MPGEAIMDKIAPVVLCGGSGTRLWPLSRENYPKQFVDLGNGKTLFGDTLARVALIAQALAPICVCNEKYRFYVADAMKAGQIILEPCARNTAAALGLAALACQSNAGSAEPLLLALPADHYFAEPELFVEAVVRAMPLASAGKIVTFGLKPEYPATSYGYIEAGAETTGGAMLIASFVEKPDLDKARAMLARGGFYWNAGIFMARPAVFLAELEKFAPEIYEHCLLAFAGRTQAGNLIRPEKDAFCSCPADSLDYAVMEHTALGCVMPLSCGWNDMGSWESFHQNAVKDEAQNASTGRVVLAKTSNSYVHAGARLVATLGVDNLAIVETPDAVLVANRAELQNVRGIVDKLKAENARESREHRLVMRPWGSYEILAAGERFQVKRIVVNARASLSLQKHHHRAEHWIIVSGTAEITNGSQTSIFTENQSTFIPVGVVHKLSNPGLIPLVIIEIQSGPYLGEDDIVRLQDAYARQGNE